MTENIVSSNKVTNEETALTKEEVLDELPEGISHIIEKLPPEEKKLITESFFQLTMGSFSSSPISPIIKKLTPEHITKIIDSSDESDKRQYRFALWSRGYMTLYILIGIGLFIFLTIYLSKNQADLYKSIVEVLFAFLGGFGVGTAYKSSKSNR